MKEPYFTPEEVHNLFLMVNAESKSVLNRNQFI
jgi:hypothetical protein